VDDILDLKQLSISKDSDGSSDEDERKPPPRYMRNSVIQFMDITGCPDEYYAEQFLESAEHNLDEAVGEYYDCKQQCEQEESK
jgi:antirestriction protein ArdC